MQKISVLLFLALLGWATPARAVEYAACIVGGVVKICPGDVRLKTGSKIAAVYLDLSGLAAIYASLGGNQTFTGTNTFNIAPVMSGASITPGTIPTAALSSAAQASLLPAPSAAGRTLFDTGAAWDIVAAGAANRIYQANGAAAPSWVSALTGITIDAALNTLSNIAEASLDTATQYKLPPSGVSNGRIFYDNGTRSTALPFAANSVLQSNGSGLTWDGINCSTYACINLNASNLSTGTIAIARIPTGTSSSVVTIGNDARLNPAPSASGKIPVDTGSGYGAINAGTTTQVLYGGTPGAFAAAPIGIITTGFRGSTTGSNTYYFTGQGNAPSTGADQVFYQAPRAVTVKNCACYAGFGGTGTGTCTLRKWDSATWANTALTCVMTLPDYRCQDTTHSATFAASDLASGAAATSAGVTLNLDTEANLTCEVYAQ